MDHRTCAGCPGSPVRLLVVACLAGAVLASCSAEATAPERASGQPASGDAIELVAQDQAFTPDTLLLSGSEEVTIKVRNVDDTPHNLVIESMGIDTGLIQPGESASVSLTAPNEVTEYVCTLHSGMTGKIEPR